jgi:hypothetical protein
MTNETTYARRTGERVDVGPGVPTDRVRWGPIMAGAFAALLILAVMSVLGAAIGLTAYDPGDDARRFAVGAGIWGLISMVVAFGFGGWLAGRSAAIRGRDTGVLNGFMVAGVGIPILFLALGSAGAMMSHSDVANDRATATARQFDGTAQQASAVLRSDSEDTTKAPTAADRAVRRTDLARTDEARDAGKHAAWGTLISLLLGIGAASIGGLAGSRDDHHHGHSARDAGDDRRDRTLPGSAA